MKTLVSILPKTSNNGFTFSWALQWIWIFVASDLLVVVQDFWRTKQWLERKSVWAWLVCVFKKACIRGCSKDRKKKYYHKKTKQSKSQNNLKKICILLEILLLHFPFDKKTGWCKPVKLGRKGTSWLLATKLSYELDINFFAHPYLCFYPSESLKSDCNFSGDRDMCEHVSVGVFKLSKCDIANWTSQMI